MSDISLKGNNINTGREGMNFITDAVSSEFISLSNSKTSASTEGVITQSFGSGKSLGFIFQNFIVADRG